MAENKKTKKKYDAYIASGWFNIEQLNSRASVLSACNTVGIKIFNPEVECVCPPTADAETQEAVFKGNIEAIKNCKFIIVNTAGKDMGTIFEAGYAAATEVPIIYYCEGLKGNFNLMLSRSGRAVATNSKELEKHVKGILADPEYYEEYVGQIE